jgi:hypothetical protein
MFLASCVDNEPIGYCQLEQKVVVKKETILVGKLYMEVQNVYCEDLR